MHFEHAKYIYNVKKHKWFKNESNRIITRRNVYIRRFKKQKAKSRGQNT